MKVYMVSKEGVYRHECVGIFSSVKGAKEAAIEAINREIDDYHTFWIVPFVIDEKTKLHKDGHSLEEDSPIFIISRKGETLQVEEVVA